MVSCDKWGFIKATESDKKVEIRGCATTFTCLEGFGCGFKEGVPLIRRAKNENL